MSNKKITIKYVRKANQWVKTTVSLENGKEVFKQEWTSEKPEDN